MVKKTYEEAFLLAMQAHAGQFRKQSKKPYFIHPVRVSEYLNKKFYNYKEIEKLRITALLHDTLEDTWVTPSVIEEKFGLEIKQLVVQLSKDKSKPKEHAEKEYREKLSKAKDEAKVIKLADIYDNIEYGFKGKKKIRFLEKSKKTLQIIKVKDENLKKVFQEEKQKLLKKINEELS